MSPISSPLVSIILPIRNESATIESGLQAVFEQDYTGPTEILITDGMSMDSTRQIIDHFSALHPQMQMQILDNPGKIVPTGINIALNQAKGEIIIRVDGHTIIAPDYVRQCVETVQRTHADNVGGRMNAIGVTPFGKAAALATSSLFGIGGGRFHTSDKEEWVDTVYMGAWPRRVFKQIGLFDEELVRDQDDELNYRLREHGGKILLSPVIRSEYAVRSTPIALWRQYYQYGLWKVRVLQKHPRQMSMRQFVPPFFLLALFVSVFFTFSPILLPLSPVVPLLYLVANLSASTISAVKQGWKLVPILPFVFAILHFSYGLGFLVGLAKFWNRWGDKTGKVPVWSNEISR